MEKSNISLVIFDLDGTLVDSGRDIINAFNHGLEAVDAAPLAAETVKPLIGAPLKIMYENTLRDRTEKRIERACEAYRSFYFEHCADTTAPFPGVEGCLDRLAPIPLAVATTKKTFMAVRLVEALGLSRRFSLVQGTDDIPPKPDPAVLELVMARLGARPDTVWMVGDTPHDIRASKAAGIKVCAVTYGASPLRELALAEPDMLVDDLTDLCRHLESDRETL